MARETRVTRSRTFTGCGTCRARHLKCDEARPICNTCDRNNLPCQGYATQLLWMPGNDGLDNEEDHTAMYRRPVFNENDRKQMSLELQQSTDGRPAMDLLLQLDRESEGLDIHGVDAGVTVGPFHAFRVLEPLDCSPPASNGSEHVTDEILPHVEDDLFSDGRDVDCEFDELLNICPTQHDEAMSSMPQSSPGRPVPELEMAASVDSTVIDQTVESFSLQPAIPPAMPPGAGTQGHVLPADASFILRYCRATANNTLTSLVRLSLWEKSFMPCAVETFGELSLWNSTSCARFTVFYAVLAVTASRIHRCNRSSSDLRWLESGKEYHKVAKKFLKKTLRTEVTGPGRGRYDELLLAVLSVIAASEFYEPRAIRVLLHDAERLIRLRGIPEPHKTFEQRLLHHMYTLTRIIAESTLVGPESNYGRETPGTAAEGIPTPRTFRLTEDRLNAHMDSSREKPLQLGYNDIHLEIMGKWDITLYPDMYGVPEALVTLLSQTISLANDKKRLESIAAAATTDGGISAALARHTKALEQNIWTWSLPSSPAAPGEDGGSSAMALGLHQVLLLYFYRRVHNVNAMILQDFVRKALDHLVSCAATDGLGGDHGFATLVSWSVFIAACEAATPELQEEARRCLSIVREGGVFFAGGELGHVVEEVWRRREEANDFTISWPDVVEVSSL